MFTKDTTMLIADLSDSGYSDEEIFQMIPEASNLEQIIEALEMFA